MPVTLLDAGLPAPAHGAFSTRETGPSTGPYAAANLARHVGDDPDRVSAARAALAAGLGVDAGALVLGEQVHGRGVAVVDRPPTRQEQDAGLPGVDALVTAVPGLALVMMAADCLPVLLADPGARVVAAVHAGRQGLVAGVLQEALRAMAGLGASAAATTAVIGPAVCGACYELPDAMVDAVEAAVPGSACRTRAGTRGADLAAGAEGLLRAAGVGTLARVGGCTLEQPDLFYSHRRDGVTGRHAGVVHLST